MATSILKREPVPFLKAFAMDMARSSFAAQPKAFDTPDVYRFDGEDYLYLCTKQIDIRLVGKTVLRKFIHVYCNAATLDVRALDDAGEEFELGDDLRDEFKNGG